MSQEIEIDVVQKRLGENCKNIKSILQPKYKKLISRVFGKRLENFFSPER